MGNRTIKSSSRNSSLQLLEVLSSLLALELLSPGQELYLISPWISDMALLSNRFGQFRAVMPEMLERDIRFAAILNILAENGTQVKIICRPQQPQTEDFIRKLMPLIAVKQTETLHEKGLITPQFYLRGSMNFTYSGIHLNDEHIELTTDLTEIGRALLEARLKWRTI